MSFQNTCIKQSDIEAARYGFIRRKNVFIRVINDVCQTFHLEFSNTRDRGQACRIGFCILPLCGGLKAEEVMRGIGRYYLSRFEPGDAIEFCGWQYTKKWDCEEECIAEIIRFLTCYLIPLFQQADSCKTALGEMCNIDKRFEKNRQILLAKTGEKDMAKGASLSEVDESNYFMALKNRDFRFALASRKAVLENALNNYCSSRSKEWADIVSNLENEIWHLEQEDDVWRQELIKANEAQSKENLRDFIVGE